MPVVNIPFFGELWDIKLFPVDFKMNFEIILTEVFHF